MTYDLGIQADLILLDFSDIVFFFLNKLKVCGKFTLSRSVGNICSFLRLCLISVILMIFPFFLSHFYLLWCCVVSGLRFYNYNCCGFFFSAIKYLIIEMIYVFGCSRS